MKEKLLVAILSIVLVGMLAGGYYISKSLAPPLVGPQPDVSSLLPAAVGPQPAPAIPLLPMTGFQNYLVVAQTGGNFTRLSDALKSITNASADNRYTIIVRGTIVEDGNQPGVDGYIEAKSHVDVIGQGATLELWVPEQTGKDYAIQFLDVFDSEWRDLNIVAKEIWNQKNYEYSGDNDAPLVDIGIGTQFIIAIRGRTDRSLYLNNISAFWDWQAGTRAFQHACVIKDLASPTITNSEFKAGPWEHSNGLTISNRASPLITNSRFVGGGGPGKGHSGNNYGLIIDGGSPIILSSVAESGLGNFGNHAVYIDGGEPTLLGIVGKPQEFSYTFTYDPNTPAGSGELLPDIGRELRYMVRSISISFAPQSNPWVLKVGTKPGSSELIDVSGSGNMTRPFQKPYLLGRVFDAGNNFYISSSGINDKIFIKYTVMPASGEVGYITGGLYLGETRARINWSIFYGTWEWNPPLAFAPAAGIRPKWQVTGSSFIQLWGGVR